MNARKYSALIIGTTLLLSGAHAYAQTAPAAAPSSTSSTTTTTTTTTGGAATTATPAKPPTVQYKVDRSGDDTQDVDQPAPDNIGYLQNLQKDNTAKTSGLPFDIRAQAIKEGAISYGARGGLAWRTYQIRKELELRSEYLDKVFDFRRLLIPAPSGLMIEPPIVDESMNALLINGSGQQAAVTDKMYNIVNNAKIVSAPRTWRTYLEREWGKVDPPPDILRPETAEERKLWKDLVQQGWDKGVAQADEIFQDDLNRLGADFGGMIRYRMLLAQGMISPPYALQVDRGVTGGKNMMRVGDRAIQITGVPELITGSEQWQPANQ